MEIKLHPVDKEGSISDEGTTGKGNSGLPASDVCHGEVHFKG